MPPDTGVVATGCVTVLLVPPALLLLLAGVLPPCARLELSVSVSPAAVAASTLDIMCFTSFTSACTPVSTASTPR